MLCVLFFIIYLGSTAAKIVAGGNGKGSSANQLDKPLKIFVDIN